MLPQTLSNLLVQSHFIDKEAETQNDKLMGLESLFFKAKRYSK